MKNKKGKGIASALIYGRGDHNARVVAKHLDMALFGLDTTIHVVLDPSSSYVGDGSVTEHDGIRSSRW